jgi:NAD(P)-dependent dehydrogenase (short-subunit alcohol dehydrogenase family)
MKKVAIITGASGGIGGSIAKRLAKDGLAVVVNYARKAAPAQSLWSYCGLGTFSSGAAASMTLENTGHTHSHS